ncbi:TlpA family protein disulfide reductase [Desulfoplanes sp.]
MRSFITMFLVVGWLCWGVPQTARAEYKGALSGDQFVDMVTEASSRVVVVNFWATWCGPCRQEFPDLMSLRERYDDKDLLLMGISLDYNAGAVEFFTDRVGFNYPIYLDGGEIAAAFEVTAIPRLLVFVGGKLQASHVGYMPGATLNKLIKSLLDAEKRGGES